MLTWLVLNQLITWTQKNQGWPYSRSDQNLNPQLVGFAMIMSLKVTNFSKPGKKKKKKINLNSNIPFPNSSNIPFPM